MSYFIVVIVPKQSLCQPLFMYGRKCILCTCSSILLVQMQQCLSKKIKEKKIRCQLSYVQLMPIFSLLAQQNSTSYSSLRGTKSHPTLPYQCLILSAGFLKVSCMIIFSCLKFKTFRIFFAVKRTADHFYFHCESIDNCQGDMAEKG